MSRLVTHVSNPSVSGISKRPKDHPSTTDALDKNVPEHINHSYIIASYLFFIFFYLLCIVNC
jgi:hypothetical protein